MPHKKKKLFTKSNSTKYILVTDGRDENGEKITENVLVPVPSNHKSESNLLFSQLAGAYDSFPNEAIAEGKIEKKNSGVEKLTECASDDDLDLDNILNQMVDSQDEEFESFQSKMRGLNFESNGPGNVHFEIFDEIDDFSDEFGQFSDAESDSDSEVEIVKKGPTLTSAKSDCPETLKILNEGFEKVLEEYADNQIGGLDDEEICGTFSTENKHMQNFINTPLVKDLNIVLGECDETLKKKILSLNEFEEPERIVEVKTPKPLEWDCESIISTYSNQYNHPFIIKEASKISKIKIPYNPLKSGLTKSKLKTLEESESESEEEDDDDDVSVTTSCNIRIKGETLLQKKERKALFKEAKRESRKLKKENKLAFKEEEKIQSMNAINVCRNKGIRLM